MRVPYGEWAPDLFELIGGQTLRVAKNVIPKVGGYEPYPSLSNLSAEVLPYAPRGAIRGIRGDGTNSFFAAVQNESTSKLEIYQFRDSGGSNSWVNVSSSSETYGSVRARRVEFAQFGSTVFAMPFSGETQALNLSRDTEFSRVSETCPRAAHGVVSNGFLILGRLFTRDAGSMEDGIAWSAFGAPASWPLPNTDAATALLSGRVSLSNGLGPVNGIVAGSEVVLALQESGLVRMDFIGNDAVWAFRDIAVDHGLRVPGAAVPFKRGVFYVGTDGLRVCDYTSSSSIGKGRVDKWFNSNFDADYPDSLSIIRDPGATQIRMSFAAPGNSGVPNRTVVYDYDLDRFSYAEEAVYSLVGAGSSPASLDSPDILGDRDTLEDTEDGTDYGVLSFDDRQTGTFTQQAGGFDSSFRLGTFSGAKLQGQLETGFVEAHPGRRTILQGIRSHVRGTGVTTQVAGAGDDDLLNPENVEYGFPAERLPNGLHPNEIDTRYLSVRVNLGPGWSEAAFCDIESSPGGEV